MRDALVQYRRRSDSVLGYLEDHSLKHSATENEHFNGYALASLHKAKEEGKFADMDTAISLCCEMLETIQAHHDEPL